MQDTNNITEAKRKWLICKTVNLLAQNIPYLKIKLTPIAVSFIFDLSQHEEEKTLVEPGHYETKSERYYLDPSDTNKIIQPCPCGPCDERDDNRTRNIYDQGGVEEYPVGTRTRTNTGINIGSGTSGGSKKSFPGLKSKPVNH